MKRLLIFLIAVFLFHNTIAQSGETFLSIGRQVINVPNGEYFLKGEVDRKGNYYYTLQKNDADNPQSYYFTLFPYTPESFKDQLRATADNYKDTLLTAKIEENADKYFHSFAMGQYVKNEAELGPEAMRMKFRQQATIRKIPLKNHAIIKNKPVLKYFKNNGLIDSIGPKTFGKQVRNIKLKISQDTALQKEEVRNIELSNLQISILQKT